MLNQSMLTPRVPSGGLGPVMNWRGMSRTFQEPMDVSMRLTLCGPVLMFFRYFLFILFVLMDDGLVDVDFMQVVFMQVFLLNVEVVQVDLVQVMLVENMFMVVVFVNHLLGFMMLMDDLLGFVLVMVEMLDGMGGLDDCGVCVVFLNFGRSFRVGILTVNNSYRFSRTRTIASTSASPMSDINSLTTKAATPMRFIPPGNWGLTIGQAQNGTENLNINMAYFSDLDLNSSLLLH